MMFRRSKDLCLNHVRHYVNEQQDKIYVPGASIVSFFLAFLHVDPQLPQNV